jgi:hypothetical protein
VFGQYSKQHGTVKVHAVYYSVFSFVANQYLKWMVITDKLKNVIEDIDEMGVYTGVF